MDRIRSTVASAPSNPANSPILQAFDAIAPVEREMDYPLIRKIHPWKAYFINDSSRRRCWITCG